MNENIFQISPSSIQIVLDNSDLIPESVPCASNIAAQPQQSNVIESRQKQPKKSNTQFEKIKSKAESKSRSRAQNKHQNENENENKSRSEPLKLSDTNEDDLSRKPVKRTAHNAIEKSIVQVLMIK